MTPLKAFVGHSFTADDEDVVRTFLKYFDQVEELNIGSSWEHAESAESKELAENVLRLMEGKNLFIGICTKNEAAILPSNLSTTKFDKTVLKGKEDRFLWKASDWIIQEIGLAIGKGMDLILLVEAGLRQPGELRGNKEYISFDRQAPEKSFGKILEMIQSLIPKARVLAAEGSGTRAASPEKTGEEDKKNEDWWQPNDDWERETFEHVWTRMIAIDDKEGAEKISSFYLATAEGQSSKNWESGGAYQEYYRLAFDKGGKLTNLDEMARAHPDNSDIQEYQARGYQKFGEQEKAGRLFEAAANKATSKRQELARHGDAALAYTRASKKVDANCVLEVMKGIASTVENGEEQLVRIMRNIAEAESDKESFFGLTEKLLDICPGEIDTRFSLAFKYFEDNQGELSLYHYFKIPFGQRDAATWNNLGVQFANCELTAKSVTAYQKSVDLGETLTMTKLAQKLIGAGFLKEAENICNQALKIEDYHKNVGYAIIRIKEMLEAEDKKEAELINVVTPVSDFYKDYGRAIASSQIAEHLGKWQGPDRELNVTVKGNVFVAEGSWERSFQPGAFALLLTPSRAGQLEVERYTVRYEGITSGHAVKATYAKKKEGEPAARSLLGSAKEKEIQVLMIFSESLQEIRVHERSASKDPKFYTLNRIN